MKTNYYQLCIETLRELNEDYPDVSITRHISTATSDYRDIEDLTTKEFHFALSKYQNELNVDGSKQCFDDFVNKIVEDGNHLFDEQEEDGSY